ncbi:hypothetical protein [Noviherbaspirillum sp. L7-7A]|uniref:hypothetical protein n=1 Tax=Noviherbaspirillum sp. L7-7A TaxID=2850560 RepID=UPI002012D78B|nr:hypothetical protein [Noviherbaspirillum sp. L7-7A]
MPPLACGANADWLGDIRASHYQVEHHGRSCAYEHKRLPPSPPASLQPEHRLQGGSAGTACGKLPCLPAAKWKQCLASLVQQAARCPAPDHHRVLGAIISARVTRDGKFDAWSSPAMSVQELLTEAWTLASASPAFSVTAQAMVLAALCQYLRGTNHAVNMSKDVTTIAPSWQPAQLKGEEEYGFAKRLWTIVSLNLPSRELLERLEHFNMHCLPFMSNAYPGQKTEDEIVAAAGSVMRLKPSRRTRLDMLLHRDERGVPWLHRLSTVDHSQQIKAYVGAMKRLGLSTAELAYLFAARNLSGRPMLSVLLCQGVQTGIMKQALDFMDTLINEAGLPEAETVRLLRCHFQRKPGAEFTDRDARSDAFPDFSIGLLRAMPFNGLSAIDSLFCDWLGTRMKAYMHKILASSLSDTAKRDVLRLDFPDRSDFLRMSRALRTYCSTVRESSLPEAMKQELTSPLRTQFDPNCPLI